MLLNSYFLSLQLNIITNIQEYTNFTVLDTTSFFYQWFLYLDYYFIFTIVIHHGQEIFQVSIIRYIKSLPYV